MVLRNSSKIFPKVNRSDKIVIVLVRCRSELPDRITLPRPTTAYSPINRFLSLSKYIFSSRKWPWDIIFHHKTINFKQNSSSTTHSQTQGSADQSLSVLYRSWTEQNWESPNFEKVQILKTSDRTGLGLSKFWKSRTESDLEVRGSLRQV